jgi:chromosome partitioning protein
LRIRIRNYADNLLELGEDAMIVTVASNKGGVGKTTTAIHLAAYLHTLAPTLLVDNDPNRSAIGWAARSENVLPFRVVDINQSLKVGRDYEHVVFDTKARPDGEELKTLAEGCDLMVIPTTPDAMSLEALMNTVNLLRGIGAGQYKILLTIIPPYPERDGEEARKMLEAGGYPLFASGIREAKVFKLAALDGKLVNQVKGPRSAACWEDYARAGAEMVQ